MSFINILNVRYRAISLLKSLNCASKNVNKLNNWVPWKNSMILPFKYSVVFAGMIGAAQHSKNYKCWTTVYAAGPSESLSKTEINSIIKKADELFDNNQFEELCQYLRQFKESKCVDIIWRLSRALYTWSKVNKKDHPSLIKESFEMAKIALELDEKNPPANKWYAVTLDAHSALEGFKTRCQTLVPVLNYMEKAVELDPSDATTIYMIGMWHYGIADLAWYQRTIVQAIAGKPPTSTYEEAYKYFKRAEEVSPDFYSLNLLMLGKCYMKLGDNKSAAEYLIRAANYPKHTADDHQAYKEATDLLKQLKINI